MCVTCLGRSSVEVDMDEESSRRHHHAVPRLNIYRNFSRWMRRRHYQRLSKVPAGRTHLRRRSHHPAAARRIAQQISPRLQMVPGIHIRIMSPISLLLRLRDAYSRKVSLIVTTTTTSSSQRKMKKKQQHVAEVVGRVPVRVRLPSVRELLAEEGL